MIFLYGGIIPLTDNGRALKETSVNRINDDDLHTCAESTGDSGKESPRQMKRVEVRREIVRLSRYSAKNGRLSNRRTKNVT